PPVRCCRLKLKGPSERPAIRREKGKCVSLDTWLAIAGLAVAILGIPIAFYIAKKSDVHPLLNWKRDFAEVLTPDETLTKRGLSVSFRDVPITQLSRTIIAVWSERGSTMRGEDITDSDPLRFAASEGSTILQVRGLARSRAQCGFKIANFQASDSA